MMRRERGREAGRLVEIEGGGVEGLGQKISSCVSM